MLDWEDSVKTPAWAKTWLDEVYAQTGVRPWIYMSSSVVNSYDWSAVCKDYGLWVANYGANNGQPNTPPTVKHWASYAAWQYTSKGRWSGYSSDLDLSQFYGTPTAWRKYAGAKETEMQVDNQIFEQLVTKSTKYDEFVAAGFDTAAKVNDTISQLKAEIEALRQEIKPIPDTPLTLNVNGARFALTDIQVDAAGRLNPHYTKQ